MAVPAGFTLVPVARRGGEAAAEVTANAVGKAGVAIVKPVFGSRITLSWDEKRGEWIPETKEIRREVPAWMAGLGAIAALIGLSAVAGAISSTNARLKKRGEP